MASRAVASVLRLLGPAWDLPSEVGSTEIASGRPGRSRPN